jgi:hypothetical protein
MLATPSPVVPVAVLTAPSPDGSTWPLCGHPRTEANTQHIGKSGDRCRLCRRLITRDCGRRRRDRERKSKRLNG